MQRWRSTGLLIAMLAAAVSAVARADAPPEAQAVLAQEQRWLTALEKRDAKWLSATLPDNFVHINYQGALQYRADVVRNTARPLPYTQKVSEQTVDFAGGAAIVHGVNTVTQGGKVVLRLRYTDVYAKTAGQWIPVSAQETAIKAH